MLGELMAEYIPENAHPDEWNVEGFRQQILTRFGVDLAVEKIDPTELDRHQLGDAVFDKLVERYSAKEALIGPEAMRYHERMIMLSVMDGQWKDHLLNMDHLKEGINLRGYGQKDPLVEYKRESFEMFEEMMKRFQEETVRYLYLMQIIGADAVQEQPAAEPALAPVGAPNGSQRRPARATSVDDLEAEFQRKKKRELEQARMAGSGTMEDVVQVRRSGEKVRPNDPCYCGSGKKYKKCHGAEA